ncbi:MAG: exo-alpha-sialidase, partial [candidate division WOR-3 bacterium]
AVAAWGPVVHVAWEDFRNGAPELYYARSTDAGTTWGRTRLTSDDNFMSQFPSLAISGSHVHVVWHDNRDGNWEIYYMRSLDFGNNWGPEMRLTWDSAGSNHPSIAAADSVLHVVWKDARYGSGHNYYKRSLNAGASWSSDQRLTDVPARPYFPSVQAAGTHVHAVWHDLRHGAGELYYLRSVDSGASWEPELRLTDQPDSSTCPSIALSGSIVHVLWYDTRDGNPEIYYKRNPTGNGVVEDKAQGVWIKAEPGMPTILGDVLVWSATTPSLRNVGDIALQSRARLLDAAGRAVMELQQGPNDIRHVAPGIYFVVAPSPLPSGAAPGFAKPPEGERMKERGVRSAVSGGWSAVRKVIVQH